MTLCQKYIKMLLDFLVSERAEELDNSYLSRLGIDAA